MKSTLFLLLFLVASYANAQITWIKDMNQARFRAMEENKFIVIDFWADWCGPCKVMDKRLWGNEKINEVSDNFIPLKINVDVEGELKTKFQAEAIPKIVIIDPAENIIWENIGFSSANTYQYLEVFKHIPRNPINGDDLMKELLKNSNENQWLTMANVYQEMGRVNQDINLINGFFNISNEYYKKSIKKGKNKDIIAEAELRLILTSAYKGKFKKALKSIEKSGGADCELANFILAYCYMHTEQEEEMKKHKKLVSKPELLAQLD